MTPIKTISNPVKTEPPIRRRDYAFELSIMKALGLEGEQGVQKIELSVEVGKPVEVTVTRHVLDPDPIEVVSQYWLQKIPSDDENEKP